MYQLERLKNTYNYDECVVTNELFIHDMDNVEDVFCKQFAQDKSTTEMKSFVKKWSLTTLSIVTNFTADELRAKFGNMFKRCYVRPLSSSVEYDTTSKSIKCTSVIEVSLNARFANFSRRFTIFNETPLTDDFIKSLEFVSKVGYKQCK